MEDTTMSPAEMQVMRVLWAHPNSTSAYIIDQLAPAFDWQAVTIKTLLGRLKKKGLVTAEKEDGKFRYQAKIAEGQELTRNVENLLGSLCNTKHMELVALCLEMGDFSKADLANLSQLIDAKQINAPDQLTCCCIPGQCTCGQHCGR